MSGPKCRLAPWVRACCLEGPFKNVYRATNDVQSLCRPFEQFCAQLGQLDRWYGFAIAFPSWVPNASLNRRRVGAVPSRSPGRVAFILHFRYQFGSILPTFLHALYTHMRRRL